MIRAIIFDCFGVLRPDVLRASYAKFGGNLEKDRQFISDTLYASHRGLIPSSAPVFAERLGISVESWLQAITHAGNDYELLAYIKKLRTQYKTALLSNVGRDGPLRYFSQAELDELFDALVVSAEIGYAKPEAQAYEITADRLGVLLEECVFTDDKPEYCDAAQGVGMQVIAYENFTQFKAELEKLLPQKP